MTKLVVFAFVSISFVLLAVFTLCTYPSLPKLARSLLLCIFIMWYIILYLCPYFIDWIVNFHGIVKRPKLLLSSYFCHRSMYSIQSRISMDWVMILSSMLLNFAVMCTYLTILDLMCYLTLLIWRFVLHFPDRKRSLKDQSSKPDVSARSKLLGSTCEIPFSIYNLIYKFFSSKAFLLVD